MPVKSLAWSREFSWLCTRECFFWAKDWILWIYVCTAGGIWRCSNPLLHLGLCNSAAVLHYKTGRADSIEFAGPPDDLQEQGPRCLTGWCCHWLWWQHTWPLVSFGSKTPCLHGGLLCNIRTCAGHPYSCEPFTGYYSWWSESFSTPFSSSQKINYNWHGDTIGIRPSSCACCKSWVCWLIQLHTFSLLSPGGIQFLGCYLLTGKKCSGKWEDTLKLWRQQLSPHRAWRVSSSRAQTFSFLLDSTQVLWSHLIWGYDIYSYQGDFLEWALQRSISWSLHWEQNNIVSISQFSPWLECLSFDRGLVCCHYSMTSFECFSCGGDRWAGCRRFSCSSNCVNHGRQHCQFSNLDTAFHV